MCYGCYNYDDDRPDDVDEAEVEHYYQIWLSHQDALREQEATHEYAEEHATMMDSEAAHAEPDVQ